MDYATKRAEYIANRDAKFANYTSDRLTRSINAHRGKLTNQGKIGKCKAERESETKDTYHGIQTRRIPIMARQIQDLLHSFKNEQRFQP